MEPRRFTRQELYDLVWSTPMTALAPKFGISDVALRKRCQNHEIPTPGVGYWAQVAVGRPPERPRLPPAPAHLEHIVFEVRDPGSSPRPTVPVVEVARKLSEPHPTVAWLERQLNAAEPDQHGRLVVGPKWSPSAALSSPCRNRAARLLDAFCKALEQRGHEVQARTRGQNASYEEILVVAFEKELSIELEEKLARKPHVLTPNERRDKERWEKSGWGSWGRAPKYDYYLSGDLRLILGLTHYKYTGRKSWSDTKTQRLDELLGHAIIALEAAAQLGRRERLENERLERERQVAERKRLRSERLDWYRRRLAEELESMTSAWKKASEIRDFLAAYDRVLPEDRRTELAERWFVAATTYANRLDPLAAPEALAKELEPTDEALEQMITAANRGRAQS